MDRTTSASWARTEFTMPSRNRYFYGKLLDVFHFELEQVYFNRKRWMLNRLITGYGVVCGLDVRHGPDRDQVIVTPGLALDKLGREIVVPEQTAPLVIPGTLWQQVMDTNPDDCPPEKPRAHLLLCYCEQPADPIPTMAEPCGGAESCAPSTIHESYTLRLQEGKAPPVSVECHIPDVISNKGLDYGSLVEWVTRGCPRASGDPCIPLADLYLDKPEDESNGDHGSGPVDRIDITVRPIVYTNDLLLELIMSLLTEAPEHRLGK
jgi:hypothetical protein